MFAPSIFKDERGYLALLRRILDFGIDTLDRTGLGCKKICDATLYFDLRERFPAPSVRPTGLRPAFEEYWGFLNGRVDIHNYLAPKGINFWAGNTTREFLDGRSLQHLPVGHMGKAYGFQFRNYQGDYDADFRPVGGIDQIERLWGDLKQNPFSRRHVVSIWNPAQEHEMALPPCWWSHQFTALADPDNDGRIVLSLKVISRSADVLFGTPYNVQQYAVYLTAMAKSLGYTPGVLSCLLVDAHIYSNQIEYVKETLQRDFYEEPVTLSINKELGSLKDVLGLKFTDLALDGHKVNATPYRAARPPMAV